MISMLCRVPAWTCQRATNRFLTSRRRPRARMAWVIGYSSCDIGLSKLHHARFVADAADATTHGDTNLKSRLNQHYDHGATRLVQTRLDLVALLRGCDGEDLIDGGPRIMRTPLPRPVWNLAAGIKRQP